ncbi:uncharacterized protein LOC123692976 [Colias croceus]|uniref:uncharacterized protein LOC123692976 n=1 Tax=Colias crocea TaxID=72248 RepID=UPI001E27DB2A|nr:uncharacterized protein LOC123692976 [Colias croceus]XP_045493792.1 uncharacterized protein LOC123692976 [Colias croceus]XP_045493793.1 uncharacterized protein LOC123692976 [Colias croceus]
MDVSFNNVLEGTRQYFMGVPKAQEGSGQSMWPSGTPPEEGTPAMSGAPAPSSRPPSAAAAPPSTPTPTPVVVPPRPPSEPIEPEPHIIHKATVMREAAEKRREQPEPEDEEEPVGAISPPSHIIRKPTAHTLPSPAPAPAAPCPSPARPPSTAPLQPPQAPEPIETQQYRAPVHRGQTPTIRPIEDFVSGRPPDPYPASRSADPYPRYQYETSIADSSRNSHGPIVASPQPSTILRQSPQTYARMSSTMTQHTIQRLNDTSASSPPAQRYVMQPQAPPPHNDRVPPIYHPQALPPTKRITSSGGMYATLPQRRETTASISRTSHFERHPSLPQRKYDPQHTYSGYRPTSSNLSHKTNHRMEPIQPLPYKHNVPDTMSSHYSVRSDRTPAPIPPPHLHDSRIQGRVDYINKSVPLDSRNSYHYPTPSTSSTRYQSASVPIVQSNSSVPVRPPYRPAVAPKTNYAYTATNQIQTSPSRSTIKSGYPNQQARMTVSVTSLVNEMNQTKQKRESPLDLSVKTVKNSADSSTTQDDVIDSMSMENKSLPLQPRLTNNRHVVTDRLVSSHKVDFAPDFAQYRERLRYGAASQQCHSPIRYNGSYESARLISDNYPTESRHQVYSERAKYSSSTISRNDYVPRIDLTRPVNDDRIREDGKVIERKRIAGPVVSNIPEKIPRRDAWPADSRGERLNQSAREQRDLMSRPVYDYTSHKRFETYQHDIKHPIHVYHDSHVNVNPAYSRSAYPAETSREVNDYHAHYQDKYLSNRHIIQKIPGRDTLPQHVDTPGTFQHSDKNVRSLLRISLETRQSANLENAKSNTSVPDLIVIDDVDDSVIEITDLTKDNDHEICNKNMSKVVQNKVIPSLGNHIQMPKAIDSIPCDSEYQRFDSYDNKSKSPESDVASRIRTKAELKVMPPSQDNSIKLESRPSTQLNNNEKEKVLPKSQKQHLFNQIREDNLRLESVIKNEKPNVEVSLAEVKSEPMNIEEIEKDAVMSIKSEINLDIHDNNPIENVNESVDDLDMDWATACESFVEQLKSGCHKKKSRKSDTLDSNEFELKNSKAISENGSHTSESILNEIPLINIKQEPIEKEESTSLIEVPEEIMVKNKEDTKNIKSKPDKKVDRHSEKPIKSKTQNKNKHKSKGESTSSPSISIKKEKDLSVPLKTTIKEESESTDDDEPLIKSKILKEKERHEQLKYQLLKDLSEKSAIVKLECCDASTRKSFDSTTKEKSDKPIKSKATRSSVRSKNKVVSVENIKCEVNDGSSSESEEDTLSNRLRTRKNTKTEEKSPSTTKTSAKTSPSKKLETSSASNSSTPVRKAGFGDGSDFHPGWEEELYRYKRSLRMPTRLIAIPRGRSGGPFGKGSNAHFTRGSTSLPDLDPMPLSPAPSSAPSAATDELYRRPEKTTLDSDLESNSSYSAHNRLHYDSEASTSTVLSSTKPRKSGSSIVDVLIQRCGKREGSKKRSKDREEKTPKMLSKSSNITELLPTPSLGLLKNGHKGNLSGKKEKVLEDIFYLGAFRKETVTAFRDAFIKDTDGLIGATEEFAPLILKSRTRTESRVLKQRATIKEVFGDDRPASAPPTSCRDDCIEDEPTIEVKKENEPKPKLKPKILKHKLKRRSSSIRDGLRSTKSLKGNDAKGRMMRLKKRNSIMKSLSGKRMKEISNKVKKEKSPTPDEKNSSKEESSSIANPEGTTKRRLKRLFGRRKLSSGFDYIRKKKKVIRKEENGNKIRRPAPKPSPESVHDIQKEIKGWFINKSIGETHLHRAARLGFTDCVAYCLEKMESDPSAKDNAGFTPLHVAAARGHVRIARLLLQYGANVSAAAQGGIRPLHEACENSHIEVIRLLLSYGADPILGTYAGQMPEELAEGMAAKLIHLHIEDVQGRSLDPWRFPPPTEIIDREEIGCEPLSSPPPASPPPTPDATMEIQCTETPLPPFYSLRTATGQPADGLWCLLQDVTNILQIKSKESLLKQIHCGSGSPKELLREIRTQEFLERAQCHQLLCAGEKVNVRASKVALIRVTDKLRQLLKIETILVS